MRKLSAFVFALVTGATLLACAPKETRIVQGVEIAEDESGLWARTALAPDSAVKIALARVPGGKVTKAELEEEDDRLIYSFGLEVEGKPGIDEVHVDARTGEVVKIEHERS